MDQPADVTSSAGRRSFELIERPAAFAASALIRSRMRLFSATNRIITPRCSESSMSLTVRMPCPSLLVHDMCISLVDRRERQGLIAQREVDTNRLAQRTVKGFPDNGPLCRVLSLPIS